MSEPDFITIIRAMPFVCWKCSRRFPVKPKRGRCPDHPACAVLDQSDWRP